MVSFILIFLRFKRKLLSRMFIVFGSDFGPFLGFYKTTSNQCRRFADADPPILTSRRHMSDHNRDSLLEMERSMLQWHWISENRFCVKCRESFALHLHLLRLYTGLYFVSESVNFLNSRLLRCMKFYRRFCFIRIKCTNRKQVPNCCDREKTLSEIQQDWKR